MSKLACMQVKHGLQACAPAPGRFLFRPIGPSGTLAASLIIAFKGRTGAESRDLEIMTSMPHANIWHVAAAASAWLCTT